MAHEEQIPRCNNGGGGSGDRLSKKLKHKKMPQRGMGVAQLEKLILEEQHKKDVATWTPNSTNFRPPSIPLPPPLPPNHRPLIPKTDTTNQNKELDHCACAVIIPPNIGGLPYESNPPIWPRLPSSTQRSQVFQQPCRSSMANVSLGTTSSSVMNFQMEPPSNQSYCGNNYPPLWPEEDKIIGMKRSYPFSMENMPIPYFNCKFPFSLLSRSDASTSCSNGGTTSFEPPNRVSRETPSSVGAKTDQMTKKFTNESFCLSKDFLTLAPPRASPQPHSSSKEKLPPLSIGEPSLQPQGQTIDTCRRERLNQQPLHSFFPEAQTPGNINGEDGEDIDLNLKL